MRARRCAVSSTPIAPGRCWVQQREESAARAARARPGGVAGAAPGARPDRIRRLADAVADLRRARRIEIPAAREAFRAVADSGRPRRCTPTRRSVRPYRKPRCSSTGACSRSSRGSDRRGIRTSRHRRHRARVGLHARLLGSARLVTERHVGRRARATLRDRRGTGGLAERGAARSRRAAGAGATAGAGDAAGAAAPADPGARAAGADRAWPLRVARAAPDPLPRRIGRLAHAVPDLHRAGRVEILAARQALVAVARGARRKVAGGGRLRENHGGQTALATAGRL